MSPPDHHLSAPRGRLALAGLAALGVLLTGLALGPAPWAQTGPVAEQEESPATGAAAPATDQSGDEAATPEALPPLEDYEASEQISEDLSVSFPVDI